MLEDGLSYPVRGDWIGRIIIGSVLGFFGWLILPAIALNGYFIRVLETTLEGAEEPPEFDDWGDLIVKGVIAAVIAFVYSIVPFIVYNVVVFSLLGLGGAVGGDGGGLIAGLGLVSMVAMIPLMLFIYYIVPAALTNYAREGTIGAAFDFGEVKPVVFSMEYFMAMILPIVVAVVAYIAVIVLSITVIGLLLVPTVYFYSYLAVFRMFGLAYAEARPGTPSETVAATPSA